MKFEILNRWSGEVQVTAEIECAEDTSFPIKLGLAIRWAVANNANLSAADLRDANLSAANLSDANLRAANLRAANLRDANLSAANLSDANLSAADLRDANLSAADLRDANLRAANLGHIKVDFFDVLLRATKEVDGLALALREGRVNGSTYEGECACLVGTLANVRHCRYRDIPNLLPDSDRPAERWFVNIRIGDTPENSQISKITLEWIDEFQVLIAEARK